MKEARKRVSPVFRQGEDLMLVSSDEAGDDSNRLISERLFLVIKERIISRAYAPGEILNEQRLIKEFSVSRTPLREALIRLAIEKFVVIMPRALTMVSNIDYKELKNIFEIRIALEPLGAKLAAQRMSDEQVSNFGKMFSGLPSRDLTEDELIQMDVRFHRFVYETMDNPRLADILNNLYEHCLRLHLAMRKKTSIRITLKDNNRLIDAFVHRDADLAEELMKKHVLAYLEKAKEELFSE